MGEKPFLGLETWIPAVRWIRACTANSVRLDLIAGVSLAAFVIPESLAYASLAQLPPVTGLYCYLVAAIAYALFGTSRQLAVGPTSALAIVIATMLRSWVREVDAPRTDRLPNDGAKRHEEVQPKARAALAVDFKTGVAVVRPAPAPESQNATLSPQLIGRESPDRLTGPVTLKRRGGDE